MASPEEGLDKALIHVRLGLRPDLAKPRSVCPRRLDNRADHSFVHSPRHGRRKRPGTWQSVQIALVAAPGIRVRRTLPGSPCPCPPRLGLLLRSPFLPHKPFRLLDGG